jgi:hypothetical protein
LISINLVVHLLNLSTEIMRLILVTVIVIVGTNLGINAMRSVTQMQDTKMERFCSQVPRGASYDDACAKYW